MLGSSSGLPPLRSSRNIRGSGVMVRDRSISRPNRQERSRPAGPVSASRLRNSSILLGTSS